MSDDKHDYVTGAVFNEYKDESRKSRQEIHKKLSNLESGKHIHDGIERYLTNGGSKIIKQAVVDGVKEVMWDTGRVDLEGKEKQQEFEKDMTWLRNARNRFKFVTDRFWWIFVTGFAMLAWSAFDDVIMEMIKRVAGS